MQSISNNHTNQPTSHSQPHSTPNHTLPSSLPIPSNQPEVSPPLNSPQSAFVLVSPSNQNSHSHAASAPPSIFVNAPAVGLTPNPSVSQGVERRSPQKEVKNEPINRRSIDVIDLIDSEINDVDAADRTFSSHDIKTKTPDKGQEDQPQPVHTEMTMTKTTSTYSFSNFLHVDLEKTIAKYTQKKPVIPTDIKIIQSQQITERIETQQASSPMNPTTITQHRKQEIQLPKHIQERQKQLQQQLKHIQQEQQVGEQEDGQVSFNGNQRSGVEVVRNVEMHCQDSLMLDVGELPQQQSNQMEIQNQNQEIQQQPIQQQLQNQVQQMHQNKQEPMQQSQICQQQIQQNQQQQILQQIQQFQNEAQQIQQNQQQHQQLQAAEQNIQKEEPINLEQPPILQQQQQSNNQAHQIVVQQDITAPTSTNWQFIQPNRQPVEAVQHTQHVQPQLTQPILTHNVTATSQSQPQPDTTITSHQQISMIQAVEQNQSNNINQIEGQVAQPAQQQVQLEIVQSRSQQAQGKAPQVVDDSQLIFTMQSPDLTDINQIRALLLRSFPPNLRELTLSLDDQKLKEMYLEIRAEEMRAANSISSAKDNQAVQNESAAELVIPNKQVISHTKKQSPKQIQPQKKASTSNGINHVRMQQQHKEMCSQQAPKRSRKQRKRIVTTVVQQVEYVDESDGEQQPSKYQVLENGELRKKKCKANGIREGSNNKGQMQVLLGKLCGLIRTLDLSSFSQN